MSTSILAGLAYFAIVFTGGCVLGTIRILYVAPAIGETFAPILELPLILGWSWLVCGWLQRGIAVPAGRIARSVMGGTAFALLMLTELTLTVLLAGHSVEEWFAQYRQAPGLIGLFGQIAFGVIPLLR